MPASHSASQGKEQKGDSSIWEKMERFCSLSVAGSMSSQQMTPPNSETWAMQRHCDPLASIILRK